MRTATELASGATTTPALGWRALRGRSGSGYILAVAGQLCTPEAKGDPVSDLGSFRPSTDARTSVRMSRQRRRDTTPEIALRRELHSRGLRYRTDVPLPDMPRRRADIVFSRARVAVFVNGCFWHACPAHGTSPRSNSEWWQSKLDTNLRRDRDTDERLVAAGWVPVRIWEHEPVSEAADSVEAIVRSRVAGFSYARDDL
jgi:DNA mismatch endonuclease, patch repair protein